MLSSLLFAPPCRADDAALEAGIAALKSSEFAAKTQALDQIVESGSARAQAVLNALLESRLYVRDSDDVVVIAAEGAAGLDIANAVTGAAMGTVDKADLSKIIINNQMRGSLRSALARLSLSAPDPSARRSAVESLFSSLTDETLALLRERLAKERDPGVQAAIRTALALADIDSPDRERRSAAIDELSHSMHAEARNRLATLLVVGPDGATQEPDAQLRQAAAIAVEHIDRMRTLYGVVETALFGLSLGFVLVLAATGLAITFGVMGVINMAHGELIMLGAYATWLVQQAMPGHLELSLFAAIPAAFVVSAAAGVVIERGVVRFLYGRPLETLLATFGISLVLQQGVRSIFSPLNRAVSTPDWMSGQFVVNDALAITYNRLYIIVFSIAVFLALVAMLRYTTLGLQVRAVAQNRGMAQAMGIRAGWIDAVTFGLGSGVAGLAGVALSQLTNVGPNLGQSQIVDSFMVVVFGGVGNLWGTLVAGLSLGIANKFLEPFAGAVLAKIFVLVFIILFIQRRPRGLFPQRGRAAES
ncbi:MAG TPA: urea ABC transporter permease subunit UrtB [Candidatus Acidoferrales bacterium]|nr:urea ABC transporter permease subunit UrtB [Candidatus Acidoferrales bacterium]